MPKFPDTRRKRVLFVVLTLFAVATVVIWQRYFTQPEATEPRVLYRGVTYERRVLRKPRPVTIHLLVIDTRTPGLRFLVTPPDKPGDGRPLLARTTSEFLREHALQIAINADFFYPWKSNTGLDYYPHPRDPVAVEGDAFSEGVQYAVRDGPYLETLYLSKSNCPSLTPPAGDAPWNSVGGHPLLRGGISQARSARDQVDYHPRTAVGYSPDGDTLYFVCVDGRQPGYSVGMTVAELAEFFRTLGVRDAINLDGGGSTALVVAEGEGKSRVLNRPIDQGFPGKERYVGNHLGVYADSPTPRPVTSPTPGHPLGTRGREN